ncbi:MAG TPA: glycoside hydrolase family 88 protein [Chryseolinea sp.]|nr:glycoside hydrolase family 88 protein [Chryseolinea sp.]
MNHTYGSCHLKGFLKLTSIVLFLHIATPGYTQSRSWAEQMATMIMKLHADSLVVKPYVTHGPPEEKIETTSPRGRSTWNYEHAVLLKGFESLGKQTNNPIYLNYIKKMMDKYINSDGSIKTYDFLEYNMDHVTPGRILLSLYQNQTTRDEKYKKAAQLLREQLTWQPRTKEGGFWHKHRYPYQMWLDGLYMGDLFYAEYAQLFGPAKDFDDVFNQFVWMENHTRDSKTGLLYHGWDESKKQHWANPVTGQSPEFWSRAMGWYAMALVDVLDYIPENYPRRNEIIQIFVRLAAAVKKYQDPTSGAWFQVTDKATTAGNYLESSGSCMFVYAFAKGARMGYLDKSFGDVARKGFDGIIKTFIVKDEFGLPHLTKSCSGAGLGGSPIRDGSFAYYIKEPVRTDDLKALGPFMQASVEVELIRK